MRAWLARVILFAAVLVLPRWLHAQSAIGSSSVAQAGGFLIGAGARLHLYGNLDLRYDANPVFLPGITTPDLNLRIRVGTVIERPSERLDLRLLGNIDWTQWMGIVNPATRELSTLQGLVDFTLLANKNGKYTFFLHENLTRNDVPGNAAINQRLKNLRTVTTLASDLRPRSAVLEFRVAYALDFAFYDRDQQSVLRPDNLTYMTHTPSVRGLWRFFPRTAVVVEAQGGFAHYPLQSPTVVQITGSDRSYTAAVTPAINALRVLAGLQGAISDRLNATVKVGYGNSFVTSTLATSTAVLPNFSSVMAQLAVQWKPGDTLTLAAGYTRDFSPVPIYGWYSYDRPWLEVEQLLFGRVIASVKGQYMLQQFGTPVAEGVTSGRIDHVVLCEARLRVQFKPWLTASVYYQPDLRFSAFVSPSGVAGAYQRHIVGVEVTGGY